MRALFLGGPWHLHEAELPDETRQYAVAEPIRHPLAVTLNAAEPISLRRTLYRQHRLPNYLTGKDYVVMVAFRREDDE